MTDTLKKVIHVEAVPASLYTDMHMEAMRDRFALEMPDLSDKEREQVEDLTFWFSLTEDITFTFNGREKKALRTFKDNWERWQQMSCRELLDFWLKLPYDIRTRWIGAISEEQDLFEVDPAQMPTSKLTDEQRKELEDPSSPLVFGG